MPCLLGEHNSHLRQLETALNVEITNRGNVLYISGSDNNLNNTKSILEELWNKALKEKSLSSSDIDTAIRFLNGKKAMNDDKKTKNNSKSAGSSIKTYKNKDISARSPNQARYIDAMTSNDMVFGVGPAGTGKTYLAVAAAVSMFKAGEIDRMVFTRPAVEAGEQLGFLPGDLMEKVDPYLRPIYDALNDMMPADKVAKKIENGEIEIAPLAFMRGRTLKNAFVVLDEAQNTTSMQMKMFLTRMGKGTRMVITGDPSQVDLPNGVQSGLKEAMTILSTIDEVPFIHFEAKDVVRHKLVTKIIQAYDKHEFRDTRR